MSQPTLMLKPTDTRTQDQAQAIVAPSLYEQALGDEFERLHPRMKQRFGFSSEDRVAHVGRGVMHKIERPSRIAKPVLALCTLRNLLFPERGTNVPFTIANCAYVDSFGRETMTWYRTFRFPRRTRVFEATMVLDHERKTIVDYLGTHQHVAADLHASVDDDGGMNFTGGEQRYYTTLFGFRIPRWLVGNANVREWWDDNDGCYRIDVHVTNRLLGTILRYQGSFDLEIVPIVDEHDIPTQVRPVHEERRP